MVAIFWRAAFQRAALKLGSTLAQSFFRDFRRDMFPDRCLVGDGGITKTIPTTQIPFRYYELAEIVWDFTSGGAGG